MIGTDRNAIADAWGGIGEMKSIKYERAIETITLIKVSPIHQPIIAGQVIKTASGWTLTANNQTSEYLADEFDLLINAIRCLP